MRLAQQLFGIPAVISAENMSSGELDELSGMTYISYFMAKDSPGYRATLKWTQETIFPTPVTNFDVSYFDNDSADVIYWSII